MPIEQLDPDAILAAYMQGAFPMTDEDGVTRWYTADPRGVLPLDRFHIPKSLGQLIRQNKLEVAIDRNFEQVMRHCQTARPGRSWISEPIIRAYVELHERGVAHSVETYENGKLVGGLYGVAIGAAFFGESMFHLRTDASKVALVGLVNRLNERDFRLLDTQATTTHLERFGCIEIPARDYTRQLVAAIALPRTFSDRERLAGDSDV